MVASWTASTATLKKAYEFAKKAHSGQFRSSGEPYVTHLTAVADLLKQLNADEETLVAALLHDTVEDTPITYEDLKKEFGATVAKLVEGVTKVQKIEQTMDKRERSMQSIRKIFRTMGKDIRVIFIKLADRLHNMLTLDAVSQEKQVRIARETLDIYCPLADLLGIRSWYQQLSDLCFKVLEPAQYDLIRRKARHIRESELAPLKQWAKQLKHFLRTRNKKWGTANVELALRQFKSIHEKVLGQETLLQAVETFHRIHVVIPNSADPYRCLGLIHEFASPLPNHIDDYIAVPKVNGYQALHTTVMTAHGSPIDVIIQTEDMEEQSKLGMAILFDAKKKKNRGIMHLPVWFNALTSLEENEKDLHTFFRLIQSEIFGERHRVYVTGGRKRYVDVPAQASILDVAYYVNEATGSRVLSAVVNNDQENIKHLVHDGDIISLNISKLENERTAEDLYIINTSLGQKLLIAQLSSLPRKERLKRGRSLMEHAIGITMDPFFGINWQKVIHERIEKEEEGLENVGIGVLDPFILLEENNAAEDLFLLDPACFSFPSRLSPSGGMRYILRTSLEELRKGNIIGIQAGPDMVEVLSADMLDKERKFSKEFLSMHVNKNMLKHPFFFALRFTYQPEANPLEGISTLQSILDTPVNLLQFESSSVTLGFHTDRLRTMQMAYEYLFGLPYVSRIFRITP